jgi:hypothetical protein
VVFTIFVFFLQNGFSNLPPSQGLKMRPIFFKNHRNSMKSVGPVKKIGIVHRKIITIYQKKSVLFMKKSVKNQSRPPRFFKLRRLNTAPSPRSDRILNSQTLSGSPAPPPSSRSPEPSPAATSRFPEPWPAVRPGVSCRLSSSTRLGRPSAPLPSLVVA